MTAGVAPLAEVAEIVMGQSPPGSSYNSDGIGTPLLNGPTEFGAVHPTAQQWTTQPTRLSKPHDILFCVRGATAGRMNWSDNEYCLGRGLAAIRPTGASGEYLYRLLSSWYSRLQARASGSTFINISKKDLHALEIPIPPIEEQRRIAAVLDAADALRAKRREALAKLDTLTQAIFIDMFGDGSDPVARLGDIAEVQGGLQVTSKRASNPIEVPYLRVANVHRGFLNLAEIKTMKVTDAELARAALAEGDLLVVEGHGNADEIGRVGIWDGGIARCVHQNHLIRVRCDTSKVLPQFAEAFMNSQVGRRSLLRAANTTSGLNTISTSDVRSVELPLPRLDRQAEFQQCLQVVADQRVAAEKSTGAFDDLFASLQQRAFRGDL